MTVSEASMRGVAAVKCHMVKRVEKYWKSHELRQVDSFTTLTKRLSSILQISEARDRQWVFRGVSNESYGLHSSLSRWVKEEINDGSDDFPQEDEVSRYEHRFVDAARRWNLDRHASGPLTGMELLASLQHTGTPTRLIDVSHEALVAAWFAVERNDEKDGRFFAIEVSGRTLDDTWIRQPDPFWWGEGPDVVEDFHQEWTSDYWLWTPPPVEQRMIRQHGAFLLGGVPTGQPQQWYLRGQGNERKRFSGDEVRQLTSIAARVHSVGGSGRPADRPMRTFRIKAGAKEELRWKLDVLLDHSDRTLFPDLSHFAFLASQHRLLQ